MLEIDGIIPQNQTARSQTDLNNLCIEPAIIPLEPMIPQTDQGTHKIIYFYDLPNTNQPYQAAGNENIKPSVVDARPDLTEENHT